MTSGGRSPDPRTGVPGRERDPVLPLPTGERASSTQQGAAGSFGLEHLTTLTLGTVQAGPLRGPRASDGRHEAPNLPAVLPWGVLAISALQGGPNGSRILHRRCTAWRDGHRWPRDGRQLRPVRPTVAGILHPPAPGASLLAGYGTSACPSPLRGHSAAPRVSNAGPSYCTTQAEEPMGRRAPCAESKGKRGPGPASQWLRPSHRRKQLGKVHFTAGVGCPCQPLHLHAETPDSPEPDGHPSGVPTKSLKT